MSLVGSKDLSTVQTPPEHRLPIETIIAENTDDVVRSAILRELGRDGQVFYLHNRVMTIGKAEDRLGRVVPKARVSVAHGQMSAGELAEVMGDFVAGNSDVLLCTTIIESGLDIPNVNTILIDRADRFGLADLYQLRGRIGRSTKKGYAYLLLPAFAKIDPAARKRMLTLRKYSELGSGFRLAMRDLELRGAGSLLGTEQSGHIAAIGFLLYCQLLRRTIARMNGEPLPPVVDVALKLDFVSLSPDDAEAGNAAVIPHGYITEERLRIGAYRDVAAAGTKYELKKLRTSLADRYGPLPRSLERLLKLAEIRVVAAEKGISSVETVEDRVMLMRNGDYIMHDARHPRMSSTTVDARLSEILRLVNRIW
jgi:transcription-repair coupling factor (superfamily II helicase)